MDNQLIAQLVILWIICSSYFGYWIANKDPYAEAFHKVALAILMPLIIPAALMIVVCAAYGMFSLIKTAMGL